MQSGGRNILCYMQIQDLIVETKKVKWQDLKDLQPDNLKVPFHGEKTKKSIIEMGFAQAIYVWEEPETKDIKKYIFA